MRRWAWAWICAILGCFSEAGTDGSAGDPESSGAGTETSSSDGTTGTASADASSAGTGAMDGAASESGVSGESEVGTDTGATTEPGESSSTGAPATWCDSQPGTVLVCHDFDDDVPFLGGMLWEDHGTVEVSDEQAVSPPYSMRVETIPHATEPSNASFGQVLYGAALPFDGVVETQLWIEPECFAGAAATVQRFALALQFWDNDDPEGPFLLNTTVWFTADTVSFNESDAAEGWPSTAHDLAIALDTGSWHTLALAYDAQGSTATMILDGTPHDIGLTLATDTVREQIADVVPAIAVGTTMAPNVPGCTMYFDDVVASE